MLTTMLPKAVITVIAVVLMIVEATGYVPYWQDYWNPNRDHQYYPAQQKYPYPISKDTYQEYYPPSAPKQRGDDAYPGVFVGMGTVNMHFGGRQVELICSLGDADGEIVSNVVWHKIKGAYPFQSNPPPFECYKCAYFPINYDDQRIKAYEYNGKSILFIHEVHQEDYGVYRCSATSQSQFKGDIETVYQIVKL